MSHGLCSVVRSAPFQLFLSSPKSHRRLSDVKRGFTRLPWIFCVCVCVSRSLLSCRLKKPGKQEAAGADQTKALQDTTVGLKVNNVPTAHVHILCGSAAFFPSPSQYFGAEKESFIWGLAVYCVWPWFMWGCTNSLIVNTPARASKTLSGFISITSSWYSACFWKEYKSDEGFL